jgi:hypothetical protein
MTRALKHLYRTLCGKCTPFVESVTDRFGDFYLYTNGYLGVSWEVFTGLDYLTHIDANGFVVPNTGADGLTLVLPGKKEVIGLRIRALASSVAAAIAPAGVIVPGPASGGTVPNTFVASPLEGLVTFNDVITHINKNSLGDLGRQIPLLLQTSRLLAGDTARLGVRIFNGNYDAVTPLSVILAATPRFMNYPWYKYAEYTGVLTDLQPMVGANFQSLLPAIGVNSFLPAV